MYIICCPEQPEAYNFTTYNRTDSESKPRCPEQSEAYNFTNFNIMIGEKKKKIITNKVLTKYAQTERNVYMLHLHRPLP